MTRKGRACAQPIQRRHRCLMWLMPQSCQVQPKVWVFLVADLYLINSV